MGRRVVKKLDIFLFLYRAVGYTFIVSREKEGFEAVEIVGVFLKVEGAFIYAKSVKFV